LAPSKKDLGLLASTFLLDLGLLQVMLGTFGF